ncbi:hypothetical protein FHP25_18390 [Vineibacter terrae]|uniref:Uncharacterized protein n=1 Tax=Vineibacter terrae TaxID=2586908 RepID=A0A5C8PJZ5_9HYPH|nr:hypothetical protein [Vineibacter terrae]TXL74168.1 hypothetical protein FHP25_18390 [Vineibacter terrae]
MAFIEAVNACAVRPEAGQSLVGRLRARIANLERILQRDSTGMVGKHVLAPMAERLKLLEKAVQRIGIQDWNCPMVGSFAREAEATCMACAHALECRCWLDGAVRPDVWRSFCPNIALFELLSHPAPGSPMSASAGVGSRIARLTRRTAAAVAARRHGPSPPVGGPNDGGFHHSADELRKMRAEASRREARAWLDAGL